MNGFREGKHDVPRARTFAGLVLVMAALETAQPPPPTRSSSRAATTAVCAASMLRAMSSTGSEKTGHCRTCLLGFGPADPDHDRLQAMLFADTAEASERDEPDYSNQPDSPLENARARERAWRQRKAALHAALPMEAQILYYQDLYVKKKERCLN